MKHRNEKLGRGGAAKEEVMSRGIPVVRVEVFSDYT